MSETTVFGMQIVVDPSIPRDEIQIRELPTTAVIGKVPVKIRGRLLGKIVGIGHTPAE